MAEITAPGVYDMPHDEYLADPVAGGSLSSSGARKLLPPSCPAAFRYWADHPEPTSKVFDFGHAAHKRVLGVGPEIRVFDGADWRTKAAKEHAAAAHAAGAVPLLRREDEQVEAMADALRQHPFAGALFAPGRGRPEQTLVWVDRPTGVWRRARLDWLPEPGAGYRMLLADYKTTVSASPDHIERAIYSYGYHQQAPWYLDGITALDLAVDGAVFLFVFQEKNPPYLISVVELDAEALGIGRDLNRDALERYRDCSAAGRWPGYSDDVERVGLPPWAHRREVIW